MNLLKIKELVMLQFPVFGQDCNISHFITTRCGGVGTAAYQGLNTGYFCGDNPDTVRTNRLLLCQSMGIEPDRLFVPYQSHEDNIVKLTEASLFLDNEARQ
jgi:copper oxidase (laccase) domain-containing protein